MGGLFEETDCPSIINEFDESGIARVWDDGVWSDPDFDVFLGEYIVEE